MSANTRTFYAIQQLAFKDNAASPTSGVAPLNAREHAAGWYSAAIDNVSGLWEVVRGVQSVGVTTNFQTEQAFQLGQLELYEIVSRQPNVEVTVEKVIDGTKPMFFMATDPAYNTNIVGRTASYRTDMVLGIYADTETRAVGHPKTVLTLSGMYLSSIQYTFPIDGPVTESVTLVGNDKVWGVLDTTISGVTTYASASNASAGSAQLPEGIPAAVVASGAITELAGGTATAGSTVVIGSGIQRRERVKISQSVLPKQLPGASGHASDTIDATGVGGLSGQTVTRYFANTAHLTDHLQSITISIDLGREDIFELGSKRPFSKYVTFPLETTLAIEVISSEGDLVDATAGLDCVPDSTPTATCVVRTCEGLQVDLGDSLVLDSIDWGGADAGGGNATVTFNYRGFNVFNVSHDYFMPNHRVYIQTALGTRWNLS